MKQAIAGVTPSQTAEITSMVVWPSVSATGLGRFLGQLYAAKIGVGVLNLGNFIALASIPIAIPLYLFRLAPSFMGLPHGVSYKLTNRRVIEQRNELGWGTFKFGAETRSVQLDRFDEIKVQVQPGQAWFHAGDLVFLQGDVETFRLSGVSRPESFQVACMKARNSYVGVKEALEKEAA